MLVLKRLATILGAAALLGSSLGSLEARTKKGERHLKQGRALEATRDYDKALEWFEKALAEDPSDAAYQMAVRRVRFQAGQRHVDEGQKLREQGKLEEALKEFQTAYAIDPGSSIAVQELRRTVGMLDREKKKGAAGRPEARGMTPAEAARREAEEKAATLMQVPELKPISRQISTLKMNNQPVRVLFETVGKLAGINVVLDPEYQSSGKNYSADLTNTTLEEALDYLAVMTRSFWKPISHNTILVTNESLPKRRDFEDMVVKVYYLRNVTTAQELTEISTVVRGVTDIRRMFTFNPQNAILVRGTVDQVALCDKLIQDLDKPRAEVVVDVIVMEANRSRTRDLAAALSTAGSPGIRIPVGFTPRAQLAVPQQDDGGSSTTGGTGGQGGFGGFGGSTTTAGGQASAILFSSLGKLSTNDFSMTLPGALLQALMSDRGTRVLQSPQLRSADGQKSSLKIGDRFPYATGSFQPGFGGGVGVSPLVSTQFQFADVGVNVDLTPKIHGNDEVSLHVEVEISNVRDRIDVGGLSQPVIGQRKLLHDVRLREGEVTLLGGLMQDQDTRSVTGIPVLGSLPVIGRLFSSESIERSQSELLIALVPHIVRSPDLTDVNLRGISAGTLEQVKLTYAPRKEVAPDATATPAPAPVTPPAAPAPSTPQPPAPTTAPEAAVPAAPAAVRLVFNPTAVEAQLSAPVSVTLLLENATDVFSAPLKIKFDPKILRLNEVLLGGLLAGGGQQPIFTRNIRNDSGEADVVLTRLPGAGGASGSGSLVTLVFLAIGKGATQVTLPEVNLRNSQMQPVTAAPPVLNITIR